MNDSVKPVVGAPAIALAIALLACQTDAASAQPVASDVDWERCELAGYSGPALCARFEVYENRIERSGRRIRLRVAVLPARGDDREPDPIVILAGGPGQPATDLADFAAATLAPLTRTRDIVLVDQRGTGGSNALSCALADEDDPQSFLRGLFPPDRIRACRETLESRADLRYYTTPLAMDDLDEVRARLGYDQVNLYGTSYGTRAAQVYMRRHPGHVRAVVLSGVVPLQFRMPLYHARYAQRAADGLLERCAGEPECAEAYPDLAERFRSLVERLDRRPAMATIADPVTGEPVALRLDRYAFASTIRFMLYSPWNARRIPEYVHRAEAEGDVGPILSMAVSIRRALAGAVNVGMHLAITCTEDVALIDPAAIPRETEGTFLGDARVRQQMEACEGWPEGWLPEGYHQPIRSDVPTLMISGEFDPVTPPMTTERVAPWLANGRVITVPGGGHSNGFDCVNGLIVRFIQAGSAEDLDTSCLDELELPEFSLPAPAASPR